MRKLKGLEDIICKSAEWNDKCDVLTIWDADSLVDRFSADGLRGMALCKHKRIPWRRRRPALPFVAYQRLVF